MFFGTLGCKLGICISFFRDYSPFFLGVEVSPSQHFLAGIKLKLKKMVELQLLPDLHLGLQNQGPFQGHPPPLSSIMGGFVAFLFFLPDWLLDI